MLRTALLGREYKLSFKLRKRKSRIVPHITDTDFADDIALVSGIKETHEMQVTNEVLWGYR